VTFVRDGIVLATVPVLDGTARLTLESMPVGKHLIQARYAGTGNYQPSASAVLQQAVKGGGK
jgi:hypothetical protein